MTYVPRYPHITRYQEHSIHSITVYALRENKRPIGFAPWPKEKKTKAKKK